MVMLISLSQASEHLRRDTNADDGDLTIKIEAASQAIINYIDDKDFLDSSGDVEYDTFGDPIGVPKPIQAATLALVGMLYSDRDGQEFEMLINNRGTTRVGEIIFPRTVHFLLEAYRSPRMA
jgi:hypothetical protein